MVVILSLCLGLLAAVQCIIPIRWAFLPLLIATCHLPNIIVFSVGASITPVRFIIVVGLLRALKAGTLRWSPRNALDVLLLAWASWAVLNSFSHHPKDVNPLTVRLALVFDLAGTYLYARAYLFDLRGYYGFCKCVALVLMPLALFLLVEKITHHNVYAPVGAVLAEAWVRGGKARAAGPFGISITAGLAGATCLPFILALRNRVAKWVMVGGIASCLTIIFASGSGGPIGGLFAALLGLALWPVRESMAWIRRGFVLMLIALQLVMKGDVWDLMGRVKLVGGSHGYHRSELITQALKHLNEWWLGGTDYTRHWLPYGIEWSPYHVDITNYYLKMGVLGGLPLMLLFIAMLTKSFQYFGRAMRVLRASGDSREFLLWCFGAALFAHCVSFLSVSYYDQSFAFVFFIVGGSGALAAARPVVRSAFETRRQSDLQTGLNTLSAATVPASDPK